MLSRRAEARMDRGRIQQGGAPTSVPVPLSFWASGGYWDLSTLTGAQNSSIAAGNGALTSLSNAALLVPSTTVAPKLHKNGVDGMDSARLVEDTATTANFQFLSCNALATLLRGSIAALRFTIFTHSRAHKQKDMPLWSSLKSSGDASERLVLRTTAEALNVVKYAASVPTTLTAPRHPDPYSSMLTALVWDGSALWLYSTQEGQSTVTATNLGALEATALSAGVDRFTWGASVSSVPYEQFSGYITKCAMAPQAASAAQINGLFAQVQAANYVKLRSAAVNFMVPGDSISLDAQDQYMSAGRREMLATFGYDNGLSLYSYANGQGGGGTGAGGAGIFRAGLTGNTYTSANSGQSIAPIQAQALLDIAGSLKPLRFYPCMMGDGDNNSLTAPATIAASYKAAAIAIMDAAIARDPLFRMSVSTLPPLDPATLGAANTNATAFNLLLTGGAGIWDQLDALYPSNKLFRWDSNSALGNAYSTNDYGDTAHPKREGHAKMMWHPTFGCLWASDGTQNLATWLRAQSPSASKPWTLSGSTTFPAPAASLPSLTPVTILTQCTRAGCKAVVKKGATVLGNATPIDSYDEGSFGGSYTHTPNMRYSFVWTPQVGDIGAQTINVDFTDFDGVTTASAAGIAVTVT